MRKVIFFIVFFILFSVKPVSANFSDGETSLNNLFSASSLDFSLSENPTKIIKIKKDGLLDFNYLVTMQKIGGDVDLCNALQVETKHDGTVATGEQTITGGEDDWEFTVSLPASNPAFDGKVCTYNFKFQGWQTDSDGSWGFRDEEVSADRTYAYITPPELTVTGSYTKTIEEKITNNWQTAGTVVDEAYDGRNTKRIGTTSGSLGNMVWENRLMQSFDAGAKTLAFDYDFFTRDTADNPGFFVRLNGAEVFSLSSSAANPTNENDGEARNTDWQTFYYDLSDYVTDKINLIIYAGNTTETDNQSWVYIDNVTTALATAPTHATFNFSGGDEYYCEIDDGDYDLCPSFNNLSEGVHTVNYYSEDALDNKSPITTTTVITDGTDPGIVTGLTATPDVNFVTLNWMATGNDEDLGRASKYNIRYSKDINFSNATIVENVPAPQEFGNPEELKVSGLDWGTLYYFDIKAADEAPNWGGIATVSATTTAGSSINPGDIVINELMWAGTSVSAADQYLELRNMTDHEISLPGLTFTKYNDTAMDIDLTGKSIPAHGYFLIANDNSYAGGDSQLNITPNLWDSSLDLDKTNLQIKLFSGTTLIDEAWTGLTATEGINESGKYYSMERTSIPGSGANGLSWYTCIDAASTGDFFDGGSDERGTPGATNRSENEKINKEPEKIIEPVATPEPVPIATQAAEIIVESVPAPEVATPAAEIIIEPTPTPTPTPTPALPPAGAGATEGQAPEPTPTPEVTPPPAPEASAGEAISE